MTHQIVSVLCGGLEHGPAIPDQQFVYIWPNRDNKHSPSECYQKLLRICGANDVLIYIHDDVTIHDPDWLARVLAPFERPEVVVVGLGGATGLGNRDLYRKPFNLWNMARRGYASNATDAEVHGERFTGVRRVAVLDAFFMAVRTDWLRSIGGWPVDRLTHHALDLWLACEAAKASKETRMVGVSCTHHGGGSSTKATYAKAAWLKGGSMEQDHIQPHRWLWDTYRDVLPLETL